MKKNLISIVLAVVMLVSLFVTPVYAARPSGLDSSASSVAAGESFTLSLFIPATSELISDMLLKINFDNTVFEVTEFTAPTISGAMRMQSTAAEANTSGVLSATYDSETADADVSLSSDVELNATFSVKADAAKGTYEFSIDKTTSVNSLDEYGLPLVVVSYDDIEVQTLSIVVGEAAATSFTVSFDADGGTPVPTAQTVESSKNATEPTAPTKEGYDFDGWYNGETKYVFSTAVSADLTLKAKWIAKTYTITWKNDDGTTIDTTTVAYGETPTHADATKADTDKYTYTFKGWTPAIAKVTGDATYTAEFNETEKTHTHTPASSVEENKKEATCAEAGSYDEVVYCSVCGEEISRETKTIAKLTTHTPAEAVKENEIAATCKAEGSFDEVVYCSVCGEEISRVTKTIEKLTTHTPAEAVKENEVAATCKAEGSYDEVIYCSVCGEKLSSEKKIVEKTAHTPADAVQENVVGATCTTAGSYDEVVYCSVCGEEISRVAHTGELIEHDWSEWKETTAPTCTTKGLRTRTCSVCGTEETEEIDVVDHEFEITNTVEATCEEDGYVVSICKICGEKNVEILKKLDHKWDDGAVTTEPTCLDDGEKTFTCLNDSTHTKTEKVAALGHDWGKWTVTKEATEDEEGEETRTCARCGEKETRTVAKVVPADDSTDDALIASLRYAAMILRQKRLAEEAAKKAAEEAAKKAAEEAAKKALPFTDVAKDSPAYDDIKYAYDNGIMIGLSDTTFGENIPLTRGMIVTVLWRMEGEVQVNTFGTFTDVPAGEWYSDAVEWAASHDIVLGYGDGTFGPMDDVTREQLAAILFRYAQYKGYDVSVGEDTNILSYYDAFTWGQWAVPALQWACGAGVIEDSPLGMLRPTEPATRGEIALAIHVFCEEVAK